MYKVAKLKTDLKPWGSKVIGDCDKCKEKMQREQTTIRLPSEIMDKLRRQATEMGISINDVVIIRLRESFQ